MSRPWRIEYKGALYHLCYLVIMSAAIFLLNEKDRSDFLEAVGEMSQRFGTDIFAYVLILSQLAGVKIAIGVIARKFKSMRLKKNASLKICGMD